MKKIVTTVQIVLDIVHDEDLASTEVARIVADDARNALVWTDHPELKRATDDVEAPITVVSASALRTCPHD